MTTETAGTENTTESPVAASDVDECVTFDPAVHAPDFYAWLEYGRAQGWVSNSYCDTHNGTPWSEAEETAYEEGEDPCVHTLRLYPDVETKKAVEEYSSTYGI